MIVSCRFCAELQGDLVRSEFHRLVGGEFGSRFIRESANFVVFPTVGQIVPGYLLIVPKEHYLSVGHLPFAMYDELEDMVRETAQRLAQALGSSVIFFEHGSLSMARKGGCSVDHAHIHAVPVGADLAPCIRRLYHERKIGSLVALRDVIAAGYPYLFFQNAIGERFAYEAPIVVSQFLRRLLASELGVPDRWNWRTHPGFEAIRETLYTLADWRNVDGRLDFSRTVGAVSRLCSSGKGPSMPQENVARWLARNQEPGIRVRVPSALT